MAQHSSSKLFLHFGACFLALASILLLAISSTASAATLQPGDVLEATPNPQSSGCPCPGDLFLLRASQPFESFVHFTDNPAVGVAIDTANRVYALRNFGIDIYDSSGVFESSISGLTFPGATTFDAAGNLYVSDAGGVKKIAPSGSVVATYTAAGGGIDLASDQCTLFFASGPTIGRFDVCANVRLADVTNSAPPGSVDIRILPDQTLLIASNPNVVRLSASGALIRTYAIGSEAITLSPNASTFWAGPGITEIDIASGAVVGTRDAPSPTLSLAAVGEPRAAFAGSAVPAISHVTLLFLGAFLALLALARLR